MKDDPEPEGLNESPNYIREAIRFVDAYMGGALVELRGMLGDVVRGWRFKNQVRIALAAKAFCERRGIENPRQLSQAVAIPLIEEAGNVDDENLGDMFASLIANMLDPDWADEVHPSYAKVLAQLSPLDARILNHLFTEVSIRKPQLPILFLQDASNELGISEKAAHLSFQNLTRLGLCDVLQMTGLFSGSLRSPDKWNIQLTQYGQQFMTACTKPGQRS